MRPSRCRDGAEKLNRAGAELANAAGAGSRVRLVRSVLIGLLALAVCLEPELIVRGADSVPEKTQDSRTSINLEALSRLKGIDLESNATVKAVILKILEQVRGTPQFVELVRDFNIRGQTAGLLDVAQKDPAGPTGAEAARLLLQSEHLPAVKLSLINTNSEPLIQALGNTGEKAIVPLLLPMVMDTGKPFSVRKEAVQALAKTRDGASALL